MAKWDPYSRRELRRRRADWMRRNWIVILTVAGGFAGIGAVATWSVTASLSGGPAWYVVGAIHAGLASALLQLVHSAFLASDREAIHHLRGAWGEENTRSELARARRRGVIWDWVDSVSFSAGDLDHLVVTRRGGLVAVDSKCAGCPT